MSLSDYHSSGSLLVQKIEGSHLVIFIGSVFLVVFRLFLDRSAILAHLLHCTSTK